VKRTRLPLALIIPLISAAAVIALAFGIGMLLLGINNEIGEQESIGAALFLTIAIMGVAIWLGRE
jgi:hypothetical protein